MEEGDISSAQVKEPVVAPITAKEVKDPTNQ